MMFCAAVRDATLGMRFPQLIRGDMQGWLHIGVANVAWGQKVAATPEQQKSFLKGLRQTCGKLDRPDLCRICCVLGPHVDAARLLDSTGWRMCEGPVEVFRSNRSTRSGSRILCTVVVVECA